MCWLGVLSLAWALSALGPAHLVSPAVAKEASEQRSSVVERAIAKRVKSDLRPFYAARNFRPVWLTAEKDVSPAAIMLLQRLETAELDAINPAELELTSLRKTLQQAERGNANDLARAELKLSVSFESSSTHSSQ